MEKSNAVRPACMVTGCPNRSRTKKPSLCSAHYERRRRLGDVLAEVPVRGQRQLCSVDGCGRKHYAHGLCGPHNDRRRRTGSASPNVPFRVRRKNLSDDSGRRFCFSCEQWLEVDAFYLRQSVCARCRTFSHYRMTAVQWDALFEAQGGRCASCTSSDPGAQGWHTDHDRRCCPTSRNTCGSCVRGILCGNCNMAIGLLSDSPTRLRQAAAYLESRPGVGLYEAPRQEDPRSPQAVP
ncbi:endonuclease VII domain-containing protein [Streptomyces albidoflavus]